MRLTAIGLGLLLTVGLATLGRSADAPAASEPLEIWPGLAPGEEGSIGKEKVDTKPGTTTITSVTNVTQPTITVYRPDPVKDSRAAIVVCPGGGYNTLAWDHEGEQVARWLNTIGVTGILLKYRVPRRVNTAKDQPPPQALMDAQRALSLVRSKASDWGIDGKRLGILGFSAGGHLAAWAATNSDRRAYEPLDGVDRLSCRPDFAVAIYPGGAVKRGTDQLNPEIRITSQSPPMFFAHAGDDRVSSENSVLMYLALKRAGVPAELHVYASGGHGFGLRPTGKPCATWPQRCEEWLRSQGVLNPTDVASRDAKTSWRPLFDGKSLDGWEHLGPGKMALEDGQIRTVGGMGLLWYTRETFGDCVLRIVYKTTNRRSNSGVFIRIADKPKDEWFAVHHGYEVQICDGVDEYHCTGAVYSMSKALAAPSTVGEWNTMEITLKGQRVIVTLNGVKVQDFDPQTASIPERKKDYEPERGPRPEAGYIGLQNHDDVAKGTEVYFKEVSVRPLYSKAG